MKETYYRLERKKKRVRNTRLIFLSSIALVVCIGVMAAAAVMHSTIGQDNSSVGMVMTGKNSSAASKLPASSFEATSSEKPMSSHQPISSTPSAGSNADVSSQNLVNVLKNGFNHSLPVGESAAVPMSYFDDAAIIGDSRAVGLVNYTDLRNYAVSYAEVSCTAQKILESVDGKQNIIQKIEAKPNQYKKIYIMLGVNEVGYSTYSVIPERYGQMIDRIRKCQPEADIYIQTVMPITKKVESNSKSYLKMAKIKSFNEQIKKVAKEKKVYLVDPTSVFAGSDGFMVNEARASNKGNIDAEIHYNKTYCVKWLDYLRTHTVR